MPTKSSPPLLLTMVRKMRASVLVLGPMLARMGEAAVSLPGGCAIGDRPIDLHLKALECMGAEIELASGYVKASAPKGRLPGGDFSFPVVSVGATENAVMAAALARGRTQLFNAAREPEIVDLCNLLVAMGAKVRGIGSAHLIIDEFEELHGTEYEVMPDRIEAGSYACAAGMTQGSINLISARADDMRATVNALAQCGLIVEFHDREIKVSSDGALKPLALSTAPFPGFATDMQAQFMAMLCLAEGDSFLEETIFENRYMHVPELRRMGADIDIHGRSAIVHGVSKLAGASVMATDLRASMSSLSPAWRPRARPRFFVFTISIVDMSASRRNFPLSGRRSNEEATAKSPSSTDLVWDCWGFSNHGVQSARSFKATARPHLRSLANLMLVRSKPKCR